MCPQRLAISLGLALVVALVGCGDSPIGGSSTPLTPVAEPALAKCVAQSPLLRVGAGLDAPGRLDFPVTTGPQQAGACKGNTQFRFGSGLHDVTGVVANTGGMGWENLFQVFSGLHMRQYARAFAIESPCNGQRVLMVSTDIGLMWPAVRFGVLQAIAADAELSKFYRPENVMLSATHTHQGPAGYSHDDGGNLFHYGFDALVYDTIISGMVAAIQLAHANIQAHPETARIVLADGELLNTNINRSKVAFDLNSEAERREFVNSRGEPIDNPKRMVQLKFVRGDGSAVGVFNWFGVHATVLGEDATLVSSDIKGFASLGFEKIMQTKYAPPANGTDSFVAAFAQADLGDASPNLFIKERPYPDPTRGGGKDEYESNAISGTKQLAKALELYAKGAALSGPVDVRFFNVPISAITVTDPVVLDGMRHPPALDADVKRTCMGALGLSFLAGAEDGPAPGSEGVSCNSDPDVIAAAAADAAAISDNQVPPYSPYGINLPTSLIATAAMCQADLLPGVDFGCQAEKPVAIPSGSAVLPFQIIRIGNFAVLGLPWEVTTMSARRIRKNLLDILATIGIDTIVVASHVNEYVNYLTTREEYSSQQYEGASTLYGPWTLAVVQQEARKLALTLRDGKPAPEGLPFPADVTPNLIRPAYVPSDLPGATTTFGDVVTDVPATAKPGDIVRAEFQAGHPRNDLRTQASYVYAERQQADGSWKVVAEDRDPELLYVWKPLQAQPIPVDAAATGPSTAEAVWTIPKNTPAGTYRLRHEGASRMSEAAAAVPYKGISSPFTIAGPVAECPD
ncbi:MAG: neutral/alkaline non-lysosomal ceramidase N-terminal domain-containing protein [Pseudomonadota bacterium]